MKGLHCWKVPEFFKFTVEDNKTTRQHISMFIVQLSEASTMEHMMIHNFSLLLTGATLVVS